MLPIFFVALYLLLIRPQNKRAKQQQEMVSKLAVGDEVATTGGDPGQGRLYARRPVRLTVEIASGGERQAAAIPGLAGPPEGDGQERMMTYPRWKIVTVAIVLVLGILLAIPNLFGEQSAQQLARDRAQVTDADRTSVEQLLKDKGIPMAGAFLEQGRLTLRFASTPDQLRARDAIAEGRPGQFTIASPRPRACPSGCAVRGFNLVKLGLGPRGGVYLVYQVDIQAAVKQLLDHREQDFRASLPGPLGFPIRT